MCSQQNCTTLYILLLLKSVICVGKMAKCRCLWTDAEYTILLAVWSKAKIQKQFLGAVRNEVPFRQIKEKLMKAGYDWSFVQCSNKIPALKCYKETVDKQRRSGTGVESDKDSTFADWSADVHRVLKEGQWFPHTPAHQHHLLHQPVVSTRRQRKTVTAMRMDSWTQVLQWQCTPTNSHTVTPTQTSEAAPSKKRKKITKVERAEESVDSILDRVTKE